MTASTFTEVEAGEAIVNCANRAQRYQDLQGLRTLKTDGKPWDFTVRADRRLVREPIGKDDPNWLIDSPPPTPLCMHNYAMTYPKTNKETVRQGIAKG